MLVIYVLLNLHSKPNVRKNSPQSLRKYHVLIKTAAWYFISIFDFRFYQAFFSSLMSFGIIALQHVVISTLITHCLFIDPMFSGCETRSVYVRLCGRAHRVSACARALCGACRYCSSTEWFVSYNGGAGRTVLRQERQDRRALHIQTGGRPEERGLAGENNNNGSQTTCACESPELGRVTDWLTGCLAVAARKYWSQSTSESSSIDRAAGVRRAVYRLCFGNPLQESTRRLTAD